jgi:pimeloyl-ACP methyl ester carboxylesterase
MVLRWVITGLFAVRIFAVELPRGQIVADVKCTAEPSQSYALYLPSGYNEQRGWSLILAFDPRARGGAAVERFAAAAEAYGYIVAGSNNSRNGSGESSISAVRAMSADLDARFHIDEKRVYTAGLSGGARVAMMVALGPGKIAGVIACSAGWPDAVPRKSVPFAVFGTAGTEDFNYLEMRQLDRTLTTPHRVAIFDGGHTWLSSELAIEALEWMELQAMKSGRRVKDEALIDELFTKRVARAEGSALLAVIEDFQGLKDVSAFTSRAADLQRSKAFKDAMKKERAEEQREERIRGELGGLEAGLADHSRREASLSQLKDLLSNLARQAQAANDSFERRIARRTLRGAMLGSAENGADPEYKKLLEQFRPAAGGR